MWGSHNIVVHTHVCACVRVRARTPRNLGDKVPIVVPVYQTTWHIIPDESWCKNCYAIVQSLCKFTSSYIR